MIGVATRQVIRSTWLGRKFALALDKFGPYHLFSLSALAWFKFVCACLGSVCLHLLLTSLAPNIYSVCLHLLGSVCLHLLGSSIYIQSYMHIPAH